MQGHVVTPIKKGASPPPFTAEVPVIWEPFCAGFRHCWSRPGSRVWRRRHMCTLSPPTTPQHGGGHQLSLWAWLQPTYLIPALQGSGQVSMTNSPGPDLRDVPLSTSPMSTWRPPIDWMLRGPSLRRAHCSSWLQQSSNWTFDPLATLRPSLRRQFWRLGAQWTLPSPLRDPFFSFHDQSEFTYLLMLIGQASKFSSSTRLGSYLDIHTRFLAVLVVACRPRNRLSAMCTSSQTNSKPEAARIQTEDNPYRQKTELKSHWIVPLREP